MRPQPRVVVVSGAAGQLGRAVAAAFADAGDRCVLLGRTAASLAAVYAEPDAQRQLVAADLADAAALRAALLPVLQGLGRVDVLCHTAGGFAMGPVVHETPADTWSQMFSVNLQGFVNLAQLVVPMMQAQRSGAIVVVGAQSAQRGLGGMGAYAASKAALQRLVESMSAELREQGVRVNAVLPSILDTPENRRAMPDADPARWVTPAALASVMRFLASDEAGAVHGASLPVVGLS